MTVRWGERPEMGHRWLIYSTVSYFLRAWHGLGHVNRRIACGEWRALSGLRADLTRGHD